MSVLRCFGCLLLSSLPLAAEESSPLTEDDFVAAAMANGAIEAILGGERDLATVDLLRATLLPNPSVEISHEEPRGAKGGSRESAMEIQWTLPIGSRRALEREAAGLGVDAATRRLDSARLRLHLELRSVYADWFAARERRNLWAAHLEEVSTLAERAKTRARGGEIPGLVARRFELEASEARAALGRAEASLAVAESVARGWLRSSTRSLAPAVPIAPPLLPPEPADLPDLADRADLAARAKEVDRAAVLERRSGKRFDPPTVGLGWKRIEESEGVTVSAAGPLFSFGWNLPLFDRREADRREAEVRLAMERAELNLALAHADTQREGALVAYQRLRTEALAAEGVAASTGTLVAASTAAFNLGEASLTDLLDTLRASHGARLTALELRVAAGSARRDLEAALGRSLAEELP